jgi:arginase family enzyme
MLCDLAMTAYMADDQPGSVNDPARDRGGLVDKGQLYQIGVRGPRGTAEDDALVRRRGHTLITAEHVGDRGPRRVASELRELIGTRPVYLSADIDAIRRLRRAQGRRSRGD